MKKLLLISILILSGCKQEQPQTQRPVYWTEEYSSYMNEYGYSYSNDIISKNEIELWDLNSSCVRMCFTDYIGPKDIEQELISDYWSSYNKAKLQYVAKSLKDLGIGGVSSVQQ